MKAKILGLLAVALLTGPMAANAVNVTVGGEQWDVTAVDLSANDPALAGQVWFGNQALAILFKNAVGASLGTPNTFFGTAVGPFFAYAGTAFVVMFGDSCDQPTQCGVGGPRTFAIASRVAAVPEPGTLALLALGLTGLGVSRRRKAA